MRNPLLAFAIAAGATLPAQFPCTAGANFPAVNLSCPCVEGNGPLTMVFQGTGQIGTTIRLSFHPGTVSNYDLAVLVVGLPTALPSTAPPGVIACSTGAAVTTLHLAPVATFHHPSSVAGEVVSWLYLPAHPSLVGVTIAAQGFAHQLGFGNSPFWPTQVLGLTVRP